MSLFTLVLGLLLQAQASNSELAYRFTLPDGFEPFPEAKAASPNLVDCWSQPADSTRSMVLCVMRMHGVLGRDTMKQSELPANTTLVSYRWKAFDVQGTKTLTSQDGDSVFALVTQIPLRKEAVQISLAGSAHDEALGDALMRETLASFQGETNWLTSTERADRMGKIVGAWIGLGLAAAVGLWIRKRRMAS